MTCSPIVVAGLLYFLVQCFGRYHCLDPAFHPSLSSGRCQVPTRLHGDQKASTNLLWSLVQAFLILLGFRDARCVTFPLAWSAECDAAIYACDGSIASIVVIVQLRFLDDILTSCAARQFTISQNHSWLLTVTPWEAVSAT